MTGSGVQRVRDNVSAVTRRREGGARSAKKKADSNRSEAKKPTAQSKPKRSSPSQSTQPLNKAREAPTSPKKAEAMLAPLVNVAPAVSSAAGGLAGGLGALGNAGLKSLTEGLGRQSSPAPAVKHSALSPSQSYEAVRSEVENNMNIYGDNETIAYLLYLDPQHPVDLSTKSKVKNYLKSYGKAEALSLNVYKRYGPLSYFRVREGGPLVKAFYDRHHIPSLGDDIKPFVAGAPFPGYDVDFFGNGGAGRIKEEVIASARGPGELASMSDRILKKIGPLVNVHSFELEVVPGLNPLLKIKTVTREAADEVTEIFQRDQGFHPREYAVPPKFVSMVGDSSIGRIAAPKIWAQKATRGSTPMDALQFRAFLILVATQLTKEHGKSFAENLKWTFENGRVDVSHPHLNLEVLPDEELIPTELGSAQLLVEDSEIPDAPRQHVRELLKEFESSSKPFREHLHQGNLSAGQVKEEENDAWLSFVLQKKGSAEDTRF